MTGNDYFHKVVIITGGSSGIGLALAREFAKCKAHIVLIGRNKVRLKESKELLDEITCGDSDIIEIAADITNNQRICEVVNSVGKKFGQVDVVINCAGVITCGRFQDQAVEDLEKCLFTNYLGSLYMSKAAWSWLKKSNGQLSFVSSVAGYLGLIGYSSYAPSKFAAGGLAECLRMEGKDDGIRVSIIYPPDTDTPLLQYEREHTLPECIALSKNVKVMSADKVAEIYFSGLSNNKFEIYCDINSRLLRWMKSNFPGLFYSLTQNVIRKERNRLKRIKKTKPNQ